MPFRPTRRKFLQASAAVLGRSLLGHAPGSQFPGEVLREFPYGAVTLTGGPLKQQYDRIHASYLALDNDRLLKVYRQRAGIPAPGPDMGGWYDIDGFVPGHSLGQYISGVARIGAATGDPACATKVRELVLGFATTLGDDNQSIIRPHRLLACDCAFIGSQSLPGPGRSKIPSRDGLCVDLSHNHTAVCVGRLGT
jgi:uncharacterized protein